jgi:hypothetical protein
MCAETVRGTCRAGRECEAVLVAVQHKTPSLRHVFAILLKVDTMRDDPAGALNPGSAGNMVEQ